jgi:hypothetical protein
MNPEAKRAYSLGYAAGARRAWPAHRPPTPPHVLTGQLVEALRALRDEVDSKLAGLDESDEWEQVLGPLVDKADEALAALTDWLTTDKKQGKATHAT